MRTYLIKAPSWAMFLICGIPFGAAMGVAIKLSGETVKFTLLAGVLLAVLFGATLTFATAKQRREYRLILEALPERDWAAAQRAAWRGPVPASSEIRRVATHLAAHNLERIHQHRKLIRIVFGFNIALAVLNLILNASLWRILLLICWTAALATQEYYPRRIRRRIDLLKDSPQTGVASRDAS